MTHLETQVKALTERVKNLEVELTGRKRGQKLAAEEADHYEDKWKAQVDFLKEVLGEASSFIANIGNAIPGPLPRAYEDILRRIEDVREPENDPPGMGIFSDKPFKDFDADLTISVLGLVTEHEIPFETVVEWTTQQRAEAEAWAAQQHAMASDNHIPKKDRLEKPLHVVQLEKNNPKRDDVNDVCLRTNGNGPYEPPWKVWAERMKSFSKEWDRLHRIEVAAREHRSDYRTPRRDHKMSALCKVIDAVELERIKEFRAMPGAAKS